MVKYLRLLSGTSVLVRSVELSLDISDDERLASGVIDRDELTLDDELTASEPLIEDE